MAMEFISILLVTNHLFHILREVDTEIKVSLLAAYLGQIDRSRIKFLHLIFI